jgi:hypothetical protein
MKIFLHALLLLTFFISHSLRSQSLVRSSMNSFGNTAYQGNVTLQQTVGQSGNYSNFYANNMVLRQGFLQSSPAGSVDFFAKTSIALYPNPNLGSFFLQINTAIQTELHLQIFNVMGELIYQENISTNQNNPIFLEQISSGVYFIKLLNQNKDEYNTKLIIQ